ncbi:MAG: SsrA-binding protein SmpB [Planctomycetaceae bacterium]|jgi:SsrA-binding protein|nr:SsrA-binding protein SmpB [Planctomycetaceae bacterium]
MRIDLNFDFAGGLVLMRKLGNIFALMGSSKKKKAESKSSNERVVSENRRARHDYIVLDSLECGVVLVGSEVKSLRNGTASLSDSYGKVKQGEVWLVGCDIPEYIEANRFNHKPKRDRKLLLHNREIAKFAMRAYEKGLTLIPLKLYFKNGKAKVLMGLCKGKQEFDKRAEKKKAEVAKTIRLSMMKRK